MIKLTNSQSEQKIADSLEKHLNYVSLVSLSDTLLVKIIEDSIKISYKTGLENLKRKTYFSLEIKENVCDILEFQIEEKYRKQGFGRSYSRAIENFAKENRCEKIKTVPSGQGKIFWPKMDFVKTQTYFLEKLLIN